MTISYDLPFQSLLDLYLFSLMVSYWWTLSETDIKNHVMIIWVWHTVLFILKPFVYLPPCCPNANYVFLINLSCHKLRTTLVTCWVDEIWKIINCIKSWRLTFIVDCLKMNFEKVLRILLRRLWIGFPWTVRRLF